MAAGASDAADLEVERIVSEPGYAATISSGYQHTWFDFAPGQGPDGDEDVGFNTFFGEGAVLWRFNEMMNAQSDFAFYSHRGTGKADGKAVDQWHGGGVLFLRDQSMGVLGIDGAFGGIDFGKAFDVFRIGGRGEFFVNDMLTIGGGVGYHEVSGKGDKSLDGINARGWIDFYATSDLGLKFQVDFAELNGDGKSIDVLAFTGEAEFLLTSVGWGNSSVFTGGRFASLDGNGPESVDETQFFIGFRHYFNSGGTLAQNKRSNTLDNTNVILEKIPLGLGF